MHIKKQNKKAFTLIELLIVIAIIGILFVVLVSKVDFATDKAKTTGVQTDFRSFQVALETVSREHAGFATLGWDTGDANGDRIRNSYDNGDANENGIQDPGETWVGRKYYAENWTGIYTLDNPNDADDKSAIIALEEAINKNLDPKLHITIHDDLTITMANGARDPWDTEYHGYYITNADVDGKDRGAIIIYSNGANKQFGSDHEIANGVVTIGVPQNNIQGQDDYAIVSWYTYANGFGELEVEVYGFSQKMGFLNSGSFGNNELDKNEDLNAGTISFNLGIFESSQDYIPGQYKEISYEVTKKRVKDPVSSSQMFLMTVELEDTDLSTLDPYLREYKSNYIVYRLYPSKDNSNGTIQVTCDTRYILNSNDDTLENAIYLAACVQKSVGDSNGERYIPYSVAEWNGSEYVLMDCRSQIDAITDFTETYTVIETKTVTITAPSMTTEYVYVPSGVGQATAGMTWAEWIESDYNTFDFEITQLWDSNYQEVSLNSIIEPGKSYGLISNSSFNPELNEYGFYFNQPYIGMVDDQEFQLVFNSNGSVSLWLIKSTVEGTLQTGLRYSHLAADLDGELISFSNDGKQAVLYDFVFNVKFKQQRPIIYDVTYQCYQSDLSIVFHSNGTYELNEGSQSIISNYVNEDGCVILNYDSESITFAVYPDGSLLAFEGRGFETAGYKLDTPTISIHNGLLNINSVTNAIQYSIYVNGKFIVDTNKTSIDISSYLDAINGTYVAVQCTGNENYRNSSFAYIYVAGERNEPGLYNQDGTFEVSWGELIYEYNMTLDNMDNILEQHFDYVRHGTLIIGFGSDLPLSAFPYTDYMIDTVIIPDSVVSINPNVFSSSDIKQAIVYETHPMFVTLDGIIYNKNLTEIIAVPLGISGTITLPNTITEIKEKQFSQCEYLTGIVIPDSVTKIGNEAFYKTRIKEIYISKYVTEIGINPFAGVWNLSNIVVDADNPRYHSNGTCLIETNTKTLISGCFYSTIPSDGSVTIIGESAYESIFVLNKSCSVNLPDTIIRIERSAFYGNFWLASLSLPKNLEYIGTLAFTHVRASSIRIPASVKYIGGSAMPYDLTTIVFENPNGWYYSNSNDPEGLNKNPIDLSSTNAKQFNRAYYYFHD